MNPPTITAQDLEEFRAAPDLPGLDNAAWRLLPAGMREPMRRYLVNREPVGHFLTAVLSNDLMTAAARADALNRVYLSEYPIFLYNFAPPASYGSPEKVAAWLAGGPRGGRP